MNRDTWSLSVAVIVGCLSATGASAAEPGFYVTASLGVGDENPQTAGTNIGGSFGIVHIEPDEVAIDDGDTAWSIGLGYRINRYLVGEVEYVDFGTTHITEHYTINSPGLPFPFPTELNVEYSSHVTGPALSLLGTLPVGESFELFLRGGALFASRKYQAGLGAFDEDFSSTVWVAGAGVTWSFAKRWAIRAEYQQTGELSESFISGKTRLERISLGALFRL